MSAPDKATLSSRTMATITAVARTIYPYDESLVDVYARSQELRTRRAREDFAAAGTIEDAVMVVAARAATRSPMTARAGFRGPVERTPARSGEASARCSTTWSRRSVAARAGRWCCAARPGSGRRRCWST